MHMIGGDGFWLDRHNPGEYLLRAAFIFEKMHGKTIVEIGSGLHGPGAGNSINTWTRTSADKIYAVDIDRDKVRQVENLSEKIIAVHQDGLDFLRQFKDHIDLLYLDFWIGDKPGELVGEGRARAYLNAFQIAKNKLGQHCLILIDDTDHVPPWKDTLIVPAARRDGFVVRFTGRQTLLSR